MISNWTVPIHYLSLSPPKVKILLNIFFNVKFLMYILVQKQEKSEYYPYLSNLPQSFETMLENWPKKFDEFLPKHVKYERFRKIREIEDRYN